MSMRDEIMSLLKETEEQIKLQEAVLNAAKEWRWAHITCFIMDAAFHDKNYIPTTLIKQAALMRAIEKLEEFEKRKQKNSRNI